MSPLGKAERQRAVRELVARTRIGSQEELVAALAERGFAATQATVSRDIAELGLIKIARGERHFYVAPEDLAPPPPTPAGRTPNGRAPGGQADARLRRILADVPVIVRRSGLILLLVGTPGTASVVAQAIDDSSLDEQEGTLAGDDTLLVLFATEARLELWLTRFRAIQSGDPGRAASPTHASDVAPATTEAHR